MPIAKGGGTTTTFYKLNLKAGEIASDADTGKVWEGVVDSISFRSDEYEGRAQFRAMLWSSSECITWNAHTSAGLLLIGALSNAHQGQEVRIGIASYEREVEIKRPRKPSTFEKQTAYWPWIHIGGQKYPLKTSFDARLGPPPTPDEEQSGRRVEVDWSLVELWATAQVEHLITHEKARSFLNEHLTAWGKAEFLKELGKRSAEDSDDTPPKGKKRSVENQKPMVHDDDIPF